MQALVVRDMEDQDILGIIKTRTRHYDSYI
jgi:hypothetical protein